MAADESDEETGDEEPRRGGKAMQPTVSNDSLAPSGALGIDIGGTSREGSAGKSSAPAPSGNNGNGASGAGSGATSGGGGATAKVRGRKRPHGEDEEEEDEEEDEAPPAKRSAKKYDEADVPDDAGADQNEVDSKVYCTCRQFSYGEMIGCDDDDCEIEWVSTRLAAVPPAEWYLCR